MPDEDGNQKTDDVPDTTLHAYADGREEDAEPGSRGVTGDQGEGDEPSYQDHEHAESGDPAGPPGN